MSNLELIEICADGEARASTEVLAAGFAVSHRSVLQLLRRYKEEVETFGPIAFEMRMGQSLAQVHHKRHENVVQLIRDRLLMAGSWGLLNFKGSSYVNKQNKVQPLFEMTRDGYDLIVGKLSGKLAAQHQIAYFTAFGAKAAFIKNQAKGLRLRRDPKTQELAISRPLASDPRRGLDQGCLEPLTPNNELAALNDEAPPWWPFDAPLTMH